MVSAFAVVIALLLTVSIFSGCSEVKLPNDVQTGVTDTTKPDNEGGSASDTDTQTTESTTTTTTTTAPAVNIDTDGLKGALDAIRLHQPGTAGASLKCMSAAIDVLNYTETCIADSEALYPEIKAYCDSLDDEQKSYIKGNLEFVDLQCRELLNDGIAQHSDRIDEAGASAAFDSYTLANYESFFSAVKRCCDEM